MNEFLQQFLSEDIIPMIAQTLSLIAMGISFSGFLQKDDKKTLKIIMVACVFWIFHFLVMEVYAAVAASFIGLCRTFLSMKYKRNKRFFFGIIAATLVFGVITYQHHLSILPIIGSCISAYGYFFFERIRLRVFMVVTSLFWFTFNVNIGSIGGMINEVVVQIVLIITMYKMIHEEGKRVYFVDRVMDIIHKKEQIADIGRFIAISDYILLFKMGWINKYKRLKSKIKKFKLPKLSFNLKKKKAS